MEILLTLYQNMFYSPLITTKGVANFNSSLFLGIIFILFTFYLYLLILHAN